MPTSGEQGRQKELESALQEWTAPILPASISPTKHVALRLAWQTIKCAALIFIWRRYGFHSDFSIPIHEDRHLHRDGLVREALSNLNNILEVKNSEAISIGNAMLWPLVVVGCECAGYGLEGLQDEVVRLLNIVQRTFSMDHIHHVKELLQELWRTSPTEKGVSLESIARRKRLIVPLF